MRRIDHLCGHRARRGIERIERAGSQHGAGAAVTEHAIDSVHGRESNLDDDVRAEDVRDAVGVFTLTDQPQSRSGRRNAGFDVRHRRACQG